MLPQPLYWQNCPPHQSRTHYTLPDQHVVDTDNWNVTNNKFRHLRLFTINFQWFQYWKVQMLLVSHMMGMNILLWWEATHDSIYQQCQTEGRVLVLYLHQLDKGLAGGVSQVRLEALCLDQLLQHGCRERGRKDFSIRPLDLFVCPTIGNIKPCQRFDIYIRHTICNSLFCVSENISWKDLVLWYIVNPAPLKHSRGCVLWMGWTPSPFILRWRVL